MDSKQNPTYTLCGFAIAVAEVFRLFQEVNYINTSYRIEKLT